MTQCIGGPPVIFHECTCTANTPVYIAEGMFPHTENPHLASIYIAC